VKPFDHVHVHFAGEAAEFAHALHLDLGLPYSVTIHANDLYRPRPSLQDVLDAASAVVVVSHHQAGLLSRLGIEAQVVRCGPDLARWSTGGELPGPGLRALCVARDVPKKGLGLLLEAWSSVVNDLDGATLTLVSDLDASTLPMGVQCVGLLPPGRVREAMGDSNLFVLPCVRAPDGDMDGVPLVLMEALAAGRPVLTTDLGALPELVDHRVGWTVPSGDTEALARALVGIAGAVQERGVRGSRGPGHLRERGFHLAAQVAGVREAWRR
jgi:glycosyltransferase involved in cell wall biosynthesis